MARIYSFVKGTCLLLSSDSNRGRQIKRWEDDIRKTVDPIWTRTAKDRAEWIYLEQGFVGKLCEINDRL